MHISHLLNGMSVKNAVDSFDLPIHLQKQLTLSTVTAVFLTDAFVLVGEGSVLRIYERVSLLCVTTQRLFTSQTIHGFAVQNVSQNQVLVLIWGGKHLCSILLQPENAEMFVGLRC